MPFLTQFPNLQGISFGMEVVIIVESLLFAGALLHLWGIDIKNLKLAKIAMMGELVVIFFKLFLLNNKKP